MPGWPPAACWSPTLTGTEGLAGLAQTCGVVGAAVAAGPLAWLSARSGRRRRPGHRALDRSRRLVRRDRGGGPRAASPLVLLGTLRRRRRVRRRTAGAVRRQRPGGAASTSRATCRWWSGRRRSAPCSAPTSCSRRPTSPSSLGLPPLSGPYLVTAAAVTLAALLVIGWLRPDPLLEARGRTAGLATTGDRAAATARGHGRRAGARRTRRPDGAGRVTGRGLDRGRARRDGHGDGHDARCTCSTSTSRCRWSGWSSASTSSACTRSRRWSAGC